MKAKRLLSVLAVATCACTLASCTDTPSVSFKNYWFKSTGLITYGTETLTYKVEPSNMSSGISGNYKINYSNGTYTASLTAKEDGTYYYETSLTIDVSFTYGRETSETFTDITTTASVFKQDAKLTPISSTKTISHHSPTSKATSLKTCYTENNYTIKTDYTGKNGKTTITNTQNNADVSHNFTFEDEFTHVDNEYLLFSLRGINQTAGTYGYYVYDAFKVQPQQVNATFGSKVSGKEFSYEKDGTAYNGVIDYFPVTLEINAKNPGSSQTIWIAKTDDPDLNTHRNVILRMETPISYSMGKLVYTLQSAVFSK